MSEVLSGDQIAALVDAARSDVTPVAPSATRRHARRQPRVREIDFSRPTKFTQEQQRRIERAHEGFCRSAANRLTSELRTEVVLEVINLAQLTLSGAVSSLPPQTLYGLVYVTPLGTHILVCIEQDAATSLMERLLGGAPDPRGIDRELTEIERALIRRAFASVIAELSTAWQDLFALELDLVGLESHAGSVQIAPPSEPTLALTIELRSDESSSTVSVIVPFRAIEAAVDRIVTSPAEAPPGEDDEGTALTVRSLIESVDVELRVEVARVELSLQSLLELRPGDTVRLGAPATHGVTVFADQAAIQRARPGRRGTSRAIEILDRIGEAS
jgi:flagellar motor switch protein FliM